MAGKDPGIELGILPTELKESSGQSYEQLAKKVAASKSTVHRYCTGLSVPTEFWTLERIARACRADKEKVDRLYALWSTAQSSRAQQAVQSVRPSELPLPESTPVPERRKWSRTLSRRSFVNITGALLVVAATFVALQAAGLYPAWRTPLPEPSRGEAQLINGPAWTRPPAPIPRSLFGVTLSASTGNTPGFDVGAVRLWDSSTRWSSIQPKPGVYDWSVLDRVVAATGRAGLPTMFVIGGTPAWAAPSGSRSVYADDARAAPPDNLAYWDEFIRNLVTRFAGRIEAYEIWVFANDHRFYVGDTRTLVEMTRRASIIIKSVDPLATVVCPGMGNLWERGAQTVLREFAALGGYNHCDVAGVKLHQRSAADPPETMLDLLQSVDQIFHSVEVHPRLWNTGTTYSIALEHPLDSTTASNYAARFFLVGLYGRDMSLERMYFYNWGGTRLPIVLQPDGGEPTSAALAMQRLQRWLVGAESISCGHGRAIGLPHSVWRCELTVGRTRRSGAILWAQTGVAVVRSPQERWEVQRLDGGTTVVEPGSAVQISESPALVVTVS